MLEIKNLSVNYGAICALCGISLEVKRKGDIVTLIGANGAGKTTALRAISGLLKTRGGEVLYEGKNIANLKPHQIVKLGISHVPEGTDGVCEPYGDGKPDAGRIFAKGQKSHPKGIGICVRDFSEVE